MNIRSLLRALPALALALAAGAAGAAFDPVNDDTDIFLANPAFTSTRPNVLLFVDNTANWSQSTGAAAPLDTKFGGVTTALKSVLNGVVTDAYNVGLSLFVETGNPNNTVDGSYVRFGIRQMTGGVGGNKEQLVAMINGLSNNGDKGNNATYSLAMAEMFNYFAGLTAYSGYGKEKADAGGSIYFSSGRVALAGSPLAAGALPANGGAAQTYVSPITDACQKNFIIVISNGEASDNSASLSTAQGFLENVTGTHPPATISISPNGEQGLWSDEYAKFMANSDCNLNIQGTQTVITYTIDIVPKTTGQGPAHTALLKSMATNGKGKYFAITDMSNTTQLENALKSIFSEVQAVNSVFASTTLPVSVNVRGTNLNQVYIGVFRPDPNKSPRWLGNLKLYKLGVDSATQNLFLADATGIPAENASTGFISSTATSYWTSTSTFWSYRDDSVNGVGLDSDSPDGDLVEKGGAAHRLRVSFPASNAARNLYTCLDTTTTGPCTVTGLSSTPFTTANITAGSLGAFTTKSVAALTSAGTTATATVTAHGWAAGDVVKVTGATPTQYNGSFTIASVLDSDRFTYTMAAAPDSTRARITAANHNLTAGDVVCVQSQNPSGFNACAASITRVDANNVDYTPGSPQASAAVTPLGTIWGGRQVTAAIGIPGGIPATTGLLPATGFSNSTVKIVMPGHGYGAAGTNLSNTYLYQTLSCAFWWCAQGNTATVQDADTLTLAAESTPIPNTGINAAHVIVPNHGFSSGQTISISGSLVSGYNGTQTVTRIDGNTLTFSSTQTSADTSGSIRAGAPVTSIIHPTSGNPALQDIATVTTSIAHGFQVGQSIQMFGTGGAHSTVANNCTYDTSTGSNRVSAWVVTSTPTTTTFTIEGANIDKCVNTVTSGLAGYPVTRIDPARIDTQPNIIHWKTLSPTAINPLVTATGTITAGRPADGDNAERDLIVNWVRSTDNKEDENLNANASDVRASVHGDVLHSRPATINYNRLVTLVTGTDADSTMQRDSDVYAFYGSNDGILHAVKGGILQRTDGSTLAVTVGPDANIAPGTERWGFIPKEFHEKLKRLRDQTPSISATSQKDYFFDGSIGVYQKDIVGSGDVASPGTGTVTGVIGDNSGDKVYLYVSLRRGGNFIYALDVTNPASPKLLWRKGNGDTGWGEVGQTWSEPKISRVNADIGNASNPDNVVLIFAAGYDEAVEDINPCLLSAWSTTQVEQRAIGTGTGTVTYTSSGSCTVTGASGSASSISRTKGRGILVVDAFNGNVVWQAGVAPAGAANNLEVGAMSCAIASDITVLDKNRDGFADRLYAGDLCGNIWRADVTSPTIANWAVTRVASLSGSGSTTISNKVKFLFPPDLVFGTDSGGNYTAVLLGSGDREHPFDTTVQNAFFMIKDRDDPNPSNPAAGIPNSSTTSIATPTSTSTDAPMTVSSLFDATNVIVDGTDPTAANGWLVFLRAGEKVVGSAVTIAGTTFFNTNQPSSTAGGGACGSNLGIAREYLVGFADAAATVDLQGTGSLSIASRFTVHAGGGYLPSPVPVVVEIDGKKYQAVISGTSVRQPPGTTLDTRLRTYWYKDLD